jgi:superfamily II DNA or RNA helicase
MMSRQPLRFLLADDPGAGKTIMAGLLIKELMIRGDLERCLIVAPGSLVEQWQDELKEKFDLDFDIITREQIEASRTGNPFEEHDRLIVRLDMAARSDELRAKLEAARPFDLAVCDEAHRMSASVFGGEVKYTKRYQLGQKLGARARNLLLMSATPHNGKEADFQLFLGLLDADRFEGRYREGVHKIDPSDLMRRLIKEELHRFDGTPLFPERRAYTAKYELSPLERALYDAVTHYVREEMNRAEQTLGDEKRRQNVGFALQILQRRLASSPAAIHESLKRRLDRLQNWLQEARRSASGALSGAGLDRATAALRVLEDPEDFEEAPQDEIDDAEETIASQASAARTVAELEAEIAILRQLEQQAAALRASRQDAKWRELESILDDPLVVDRAANLRRKLVIFTEPRDGGRANAEEFFIRGMRQALQAMRAAAEETTPIAIFYAFKQTEDDSDGVTSAGWAAFLQATIDSGLAIDGTWPLRTELGTRNRGRASNALASSIVLACRKRDPDARVATRDELVRALRREMPPALHIIRAAGVGPVDMAQAAIGPGMGVFSRYRAVLEDSGETMPVRTALALINQIRDEVDHDDDAAYDAETRFALDWFGEAGWEARDSGRAILLANAKNLALDRLSRLGLIETQGGKARLVPRDALNPSHDPANAPPIVWQAAQHLAHALVSPDGGQEKAAAVFAGLGATRELVRALAYRLYGLAERKGWAQEALVWNRLAEEWRAIEDTAEQLETRSPARGTTPDLFGARP